MVEFAEEAAKFGLVGEVVLDSEGSEAIEHSEFLFAQALVNDKRVGVGVHAGGFHDKTSGVARANVGRSENNVRAFLRRQIAEPFADRNRLALPQRRQRDIYVPDVEIDPRLAGFNGGIARDIAGGLAVADDVDEIRPDLGRIHA